MLRYGPRMSRVWLSALVALASCAESDERPLTVEYATEAILAPSCGNAQCHSSFRQAGGFALDTVDAVKFEMVELADLELGVDGEGQPIVTKRPNESELIEVLVRAVDRMPYDQPLPDNDIDYLRRYLEAGAPGGQCRPQEGNVCLDPIEPGLGIGPLVMSCGDDYNFDAIVEDCGRRVRSENMKWVCRNAECVETACGGSDKDCP